MADRRFAYPKMQIQPSANKFAENCLCILLLCEIGEIIYQKGIDEKKKYGIICCSAVKIPRQLYYAQFYNWREVRCETMSNVIVKENETLDSALRRFKRNCAKAGIQQEIRKREHYEKPSVRRKKKSEAARKRKYN